MSEDGVIRIMCFQSDEAEAKHPESDQVVRGRIPMASWIIKQVKEKPGLIKVTYFLEIDFRGNVPNFILTTAFKDNTRKMLLIRELVK